MVTINFWNLLILTYKPCLHAGNGNNANDYNFDYDDKDDDMTKKKNKNMAFYGVGGGVLGGIIVIVVVTIYKSEKGMIIFVLIS